MANKLAEMMESNDKGARLANNVLSRAFRDTLADLEVTMPELHTLIEVFLKDPSRQIELGLEGPIDQNKLANDRGNLKKEIENDVYTIKVFMKLMRMLRMREFSMTFNGTWHDGKELNDGKGLTYNIDFEIEDTVDEVPEELLKSFNKTIAEMKELDKVLKLGEAA